MRPRVLSIIGTLLAITSVVGLLFQWSICWVLCPQALIVMFVRQARHSYDSLGAADYPDLAMALVYWIAIGWVLSRAVRTGKIKSVAVRVAAYHLVAIVLAVLICSRAWGW
jgi:hypothetical protein